MTIRYRTPLFAMPFLTAPNDLPFEQVLDDAVTRGTKTASNDGARLIVILPPGEALNMARRTYPSLKIYDYESAANIFGKAGDPVGLTEACEAETRQAARVLLAKTGAAESETERYLRLFARCERLYGAPEAAAEALTPFAASDRAVLRLTMLCRHLDDVMAEAGKIRSGRLFHLRSEAWLTCGPAVIRGSSVWFLAAYLPDAEDVRVQRMMEACAAQGEALALGAPEAPVTNEAGMAARVLLASDEHFPERCAEGKAPRGWFTAEHPHLQREAERAALLLRQAANEGKIAALAVKDRRLAELAEAACASLGVSVVSGFAETPEHQAAEQALSLAVSFADGRLPAEEWPALVENPFFAFGTVPREERAAEARRLREAVLRLRRGTREIPPCPSPSLDDLADEPGLPPETRDAALAFFGRISEAGVSGLSARECAGRWTELLHDLCADPEHATKIAAALEGMASDAPYNDAPLSFEGAAAGLAVAVKQAFPPPSFTPAGKGAVSVAPPEKLRLLTFDLLILAGRTEDEEDGAADDLPEPLRPQKTGGETVVLLAGARAAVFSRSRERFGSRRRACRFSRRLALLGAPPAALPEEEGASPWRPAFDANMVRRPEPRPPVSLRPVKLAATGAETLMRNPFRFYASEILKLRPEELPGEEFTVREHGITLHAAAEQLAAEWREQGTLPDARLLQTVLEALAEQKFGKRASPVRRAFWNALAERTAAALAALETEASARGARCKTEAAVEWYLPCREDDAPNTEEGGRRGVTVRARIDRLEETPDELFLLDFKTGAVPSRRDWRNGMRAQLPLSLAACAARHPKERYRLAALQPSSARPMTSKAEGEEAAALAEGATHGARRLALHYLLSAESCFLYLPPDNDPDDYAYLARHAEWRYNRKNTLT